MTNTKHPKRVRRLAIVNALNHDGYSREDIVDITGYSLSFVVEALLFVDTVAPRRPRSCRYKEEPHVSHDHRRCRS